MTRSLLRLVLLGACLAALLSTPARAQTADAPAASVVVRADARPSLAASWKAAPLRLSAMPATAMRVPVDVAALDDAPSLGDAPALPDVQDADAASGGRRRTYYILGGVAAAGVATAAILLLTGGDDGGSSIPRPPGRPQ